MGVLACLLAGKAVSIWRRPVLIIRWRIAANRTGRFLNRNHLTLVLAAFLTGFPLDQTLSSSIAPCQIKFLLEQSVQLALTCSVRRLIVASHAAFGVPPAAIDSS